MKSHSRSYSSLLTHGSLVFVMATAQPCIHPLYYLSCGWASIQVGMDIKLPAVKNNSKDVSPLFLQDLLSIRPSILWVFEPLESLPYHGKLHCTVSVGVLYVHHDNKKKRSTRSESQQLNYLCDHGNIIMT